MEWYKRTYHCYIKKNEQLALVGDPDIFICHFGLFVAVELKFKYNKLEKLQGIKLREIKNSNGITGVAYSLQEFKDIINIADIKAVKMGLKK